MKRRIECIKDNQLTLSLISFIHFGGLGHFKPINTLDPMILMKWRKKEAKTSIKKEKKHILPAGNRFTSVGNRFPECGVQILKKNKVEIDFLQREIDFLHTTFKKSALGGIKLDLSKHTNTL